LAEPEKTVPGTGLERDLITHGNITFVPVMHGKLEFALVVRRLAAKIKFDAVAVEFPDTLRRHVLKAVERLPYLSVVMYQEKDGRHVYLPIEPQDPMVAASTAALHTKTPLYFIDRDTEGYPRQRDALPDPYTVTKLGLVAYVQAYEHVFGQDEPHIEDRLREMTMAWHLRNLASVHHRVLCVLGLAHYPRVRRLLNEPTARPLGRTKRDNVTLADLAADSCREIMSDMPYLAAEFVRAGKSDADEHLDRLMLQRRLINEACDRHHRHTKEEISRGQLAVLFKFARNYAIIQSYLTPDLYQLLVAARGVADDNFAYEVWELGSTYPWQEKDSRLPTLHLRGEDLYLDTKKIRFYRRFRQSRRRLAPLPVKKRKKEANPGEWKDAWHGQNICSHPQEDIVVEGFGDYIKKKTRQILSAEHQRVQPFSTSMLDGLDMRETIRNWHEGRLYVRENRPVQGKVGSVVIIFDYDNSDPEGREQYPWRMSWLGEHAQESDMAFYATPCGEHIVGPGISRCEYGGFMLTYPPLRLYDIWRDPFFDDAGNKAERLLKAGIDYSEERLVAYIAPKPPPDRVKNLANYYGKKVVYIPIGQFSPITIRKIRSFHVLDGRRVRHWAKDYI
jgi:hypothetical protein